MLKRPMKMEQTECSETSAYKIQMLGNHPQNRIRYYSYNKTNEMHKLLKFASKLSANLYDIYHCCVYSSRLITMDRGTVRNM